MNELKDLLSPYPLEPATIVPLEGYGSCNYQVTDTQGRTFVLKHHTDPATFGLIAAENTLMDYLAARLPVELSQPAFPMLHRYEDGTFSRLLGFVAGTFLAEIPKTEGVLHDFGKKIALLDRELLAYRDPWIESYRHDWDLSQCLLSWPNARHIPEASRRKLVDFYFDQYRQEIVPVIPQLRHSIIHNDLNDWNVLTTDGLISGFIDFGDICYAPLINELAVALTYVMLSGPDPVQAALPVISAYQQILPLTGQEIEQLPVLIAARLCQSVCHSAAKKAAGGDTSYILISEAPAWQLLEQWVTLNPVFLKNKFREAAGLAKTDFADKTPNIRALRQKHLGKSLSLSYNDPIHMTGAAFQYMYDAAGHTYLDAYNNIPHIGHSHPKVSEAISRQTRRLNTNTRYLYDSIAAYSEQLLAYFPEKLSKVFFVNSGSEASDLAIRMAQTYARREHLLVMEHGYHGNTRMGINISSYKFDGKAGTGAPSFVTTLPLPKTYQGKFSTGEAYAKEAIALIESLWQSGIQPAAFIAEPISGCGGQVPLAPGYLAALRPYLSQKGIVCIMDEVQVGFGRLGDHFWGFEMQGIVPDMVVLGKPIGNGHPIGAVVTTDAIADAFANGMEFFSSFGGNPVSMEVAQAVLDVMEAEQLQQQAKDTGDYFARIAQGLVSDFPHIGDIRCQGLFLGMEFTDPATGQPATQMANRIKNAMKDHFILTSTDGPFDNVIKLKPPLCFNRANVDQFFDAFVAVMKK
ncbi:MAG: aminotransferase class III-fold pyridoxal phosphate-dependent enzyme [Cyclobacteriaceae bacterium]|nr:aminotransferase class III-fold pyridoxal phosphate-dependent enzyme [Cyclobacteriaceae bacterium]